MAGETAAYSRYQSFDQRYNAKLGPILFNVSAGTSLTYNDNINLAETGKMSDFIITPNVGITAHWPVTALNSLNLTVGLAYSKYIEHPEADTQNINITPDSMLDFIVFVGDFKFTFYDSFYFQQDPVDEIALANVTTFGRISNTAGVNVDWDLNDVVLSLGYSHTNFMSTSAEFNYVDSTTDTITQRTSFTVNPTTTAGLSNAFSYTTYDQDVLNRSWTFMSGPFVNTQLTPYLSLSATAGIQYINASDGGTIDDNSGDCTTWYASLSLSHRINNYVTETLTLAHTNPVGLNSNFVELSSVQHNATWQVLRDVSLGSLLFIEYGQDSGGDLSEDVWRYGAGLNANYNLTEKTTLGLSYNYTQRDSNAFMRDYTQNVVTFTVNHQF